MKYRKKPVVIDAWQWNGHTPGDARKFCTDNIPDRNFGVGGLKGKIGMIIPTLEGDHVAEAGDWIIRGVKGEYYPCKPDIFKLTYEPV